MTTNEHSRCPHCGQQTEAQEFCEQCGRILPILPGQSYFAKLGYPTETLNLDLSDLDTRFFALSKKFHPDRFASKTPEEVQLSHDWSSEINNAYRTLKDPVSRAKYIVERELGSFEEKSAKVPMEMAELFFELHDVLDIIRDSDGNPPADAVKQAEEARADLQKKVRYLEASLQSKFTEYDFRHEKATLAEIKEILSERSYIKSFLREMDSTLGEK
jgi:molecular chaperone HscB